MSIKQIKVAHIIDENTLIINYGLRDNYSLREKYKLNVGDILEVYEGGFEIIDPDTNENLGIYENIKSTIEISDIKEKFSVCKKIKANYLNDIMYLSPMHKKLNSKKNNGINIGDKVRKKF